MVGSNILTRKQLQKMTNEQLIDFAMKLQDNLMSKQTKLINGSKEFWEKLYLVKAKFDDLKMKLFRVKFMVPENTLTTLSINHKKLNDRIIEMEKNTHRLEHAQYSRRECIGIPGFPNSITNNLLEEHIILFFKKLGVVMEPMDIVACHRPEETGRVIVKELNTKDAQNVLEEKHKLTSINLNDVNTYTNNK